MGLSQKRYTIDVQSITNFEKFVGLSQKRYTIDVQSIRNFESKVQNFEMGYVILYISEALSYQNNNYMV